MQGYERDPRSLAKRAEAYLKSTGIADYALFGPENEFFIFDSVRFGNDMRGCFYAIDSVQGAWSSGTEYADGNRGHRPVIKGGYFPVPPVDAFQDIRSAMCLALEELGLKVEVHHHEVATGGQGEIGVGAGTLVQKADQVQILKYAVLNVAQRYGKTATFMPKPLVGDNGSGMHVHQSLQKEGRALFAGDKYGGLSDIALYYIGGIIKHARALNAFTNAGTNSYKRLVPGFEAPVMLAYSARNRSASIRIPWVSNPKARRIEVRFPDSSANPYFAFAAMMMAGLDGIQNKIHPGRPRRQGSLRPGAGGSQAHPDGLPLARHGHRSSRQGSRVPDPRRSVHQRCDRCLHRPEDAGDDAIPHGDPPGGDGALLQLLMEES